MDEKQQVISILRALLVSNAKKGAMSLCDLKRDYCLREGKTKIPVFEYKNVGEFLRQSGEFIMSVVNGVVIVEEKPKLESSHIKKLVTEQKSRHIFATTSINLPKQRNNSSRNMFPGVENCPKNLSVVPVHAEKPSSTFTFEEYEKLSENTHRVNGKWLETENGYQEKPLPAKYQTISEDPSIRGKNVSEKSYVASRLKLLETIFPCTVVNDNGKYDARICINHINHFGYGCNVDEAKSNAAINALKYLTKHKKNDNEFNSTDSLFSPNDDGLFSFVDDDYIPSMEKMNRKIRDAVGEATVSSAENNVTGNILSSTRVIDELQISAERNILAQKLKTYNWKHIEIVNGIYKVTVKIDGSDYFGKGINISAAISDCATEVLKVQRELGPNKSFNALNDMYKGLNYQIIDGDAKNNCEVIVQVHYGRGKTFKMAKDNTAEKCLKSICSGQHRKTIENDTHLEKVTSNQSFKALKNMYPGLDYTLRLDENNNYTVKLMVRWTSYVGKTIEEATNDAVKKCRQFEDNVPRIKP